mmetsp:Transcript_14992/g.26421  ORF Transcript_14992/g.26421 Transcript_14992/m.26421 type:complete len:206 (-) Transcript_14992:1517-2134(-)
MRSRNDVTDVQAHVLGLLQRSLCILLSLRLDLFRSLRHLWLRSLLLFQHFVEARLLALELRLQVACFLLQFGLLRRKLVHIYLKALRLRFMDLRDAAQKEGAGKERSHREVLGVLLVDALGHGKCNSLHDRGVVNDCSNNLNKENWKSKRKQHNIDERVEVHEEHQSTCLTILRVLYHIPDAEKDSCAAPEDVQCVQQAQTSTCY